MKEKKVPKILFFAGDKSPKETVLEKVIIIGFSSIMLAKCLQKEHKKTGLWLFATSTYEIDKKKHVRYYESEKSKGMNISGNEYICKDVIIQEKLEE